MSDPDDLIFQNSGVTVASNPGVINYTGNVSASLSADGNILTVGTKANGTSAVTVLGTTGTVSLDPTLGRVFSLTPTAGITLMLGDPNVAQFLAQNSTVSNELGSLLALKNAQGTTVHDKLTAAGIISTNDTPAQITSKVKILLQEATNAHDAIASASTDLYKQTDPLLQDPNNPMRGQVQHQAFVENALEQQGYNYNTLLQEMQDKAPAGHQPALDAKSGKPVFATPDEISNGSAIPL